MWISYCCCSTFNDHTGDVIVVQKMYELILPVHDPHPLSLLLSTIVKPGFCKWEVGFQPQLRQRRNCLNLHLFKDWLPVWERKRIIRRKQRSAEKLKDHIVYHISPAFVSNLCLLYHVCQDGDEHSIVWLEAVADDHISDDRVEWFRSFVVVKELVDNEVAVAMEKIASV